MWQLFTLVANLEIGFRMSTNVEDNYYLREFRVSFKYSSLGERLTNISVLLFPPREFCSRWVSLEFLYGTWEFFCARAMMTLLRLDRDLLIAWASVRRTPSLPLSLTLSLPARSTCRQSKMRTIIYFHTKLTKLRVPQHDSAVLLLWPSILNMKTE